MYIIHILIYIGGLVEFASSYKKRGIYINEKGNQVYKEWAPGAKEVYITGDFCNWDRKKHQLTRTDFGNWEIELPKGKNNILFFI